MKVDKFKVGIAGVPTGSMVVRNDDSRTMPHPHWQKVANSFELWGYPAQRAALEAYKYHGAEVPEKFAKFALANGMGDLLPESQKGDVK